MQLIPKLEIKSLASIVNFLDEQTVGRVATLDEQGFPQIIPMNFVYVKYGIIDTLTDNGNIGAIYMHSHPFGEKIENIKRNSKVGFEVDSYVCFLPSYFFHPNDASQADTLYISIVIKGNASIVQDPYEKAKALNVVARQLIQNSWDGPIGPLVQAMHAERVDGADLPCEWRCAG